MTRAHAKLNVGLTVLAREESGFHQIETLFSLIELHDELEITLAGDGIEIDVTGLPAGPDVDNLAYRAARALFAHAGLDPGVRIRLDKRIPAGAGLGGGSSDAAATLIELNALLGHPLGARDLREIGLDLGSDVPFFLARTPFAFAWGRGQRMLRLPAPPRAHVLVVVPPAGIATGEAYEALSRTRTDSAPKPARALEPADLTDWGRLATIAANDFEAIAFDRFPTLQRACTTMNDSGARIAALTGSGSAVFGLFDDNGARDDAAQAIRAEELDLELIETTTVTTLGG